MPRWSISPSGVNPVRARFPAAALAGHAALAALLLAHRPRPLPEPPALPALLLELTTQAAAPAESLLVATDLPEPPDPGPVTWPAPAPRPALRPPLSQATVSQATAPQARPAAIPAEADPTPSAIAAWQAALQAWIDRNRRYPPAARFRQEEGVVHIRFELDPAGRVLHAEIATESGSQALDAAALALLHGATLPAPPPGTPAAARLVTAPIRYRLE